VKKLLFYFDPSAQKMFTHKLTAAGEKKTVLSTYNNFVAQSEIVVRVLDLDVDERIEDFVDKEYPFYKVSEYFPIKAGRGIFFEPISQTFKAQEYGFAVLIDKVLQILPVRRISQDKTQVIFNVVPTKLCNIPSEVEIQEQLSGEGITRIEASSAIAAALSKIDVNVQEIHRIVAAKGVAPIPQCEEYFVPLIDVGKKAGALKDDGSIDFKDVGYVIQVQKKQEVLRRIPETIPADGIDVYGDTIPAGHSSHNGYMRGENIVQSGSDPNIFVAACDGVIKVNGRTISIYETLIITSDIDYNTGNIDFLGSVEVKGSLKPGFIIKAKGDVSVLRSVEDGIIETDGNVEIGSGVVGKDMVKISCGGNFSARYLQNACVEAGGDIFVHDSIINSNVFSNKSISVTGKTGKIIGGETTALEAVVAKTIGSVNETVTTISVGRNLDVEKELEENRKEFQKWTDEANEIKRQLRVGYGEAVFKDPQKTIPTLPTLKQRQCLALLNQLNACNKEIRGSIAKAEEISAKLKFDKEPVIIASDKVFPGVTLNIKKRVRKIDKPFTNAKFYECEEAKEIRFTSAM
jgi:uncharacterized protein (DUF342 family)